MMRLPPFAYLAPATIESAIADKAEAPPDAMYVAGGTDLYPNMKRRHQEPGTLIALHAIDELKRIDRDADGGLAIGAAATLTEVRRDPRVRAEYPALAEACRLISTPILQNMGTLGGNLLLDTRCNYYDQNYDWRKSIDFCMKKDGHTCWVAPSSPKCLAVSSTDTAPMLQALGASVTLVSSHGQRILPVADLYANDGIHYLARRPDEILTTIALPRAYGWRSERPELWFVR